MKYNCPNGHGDSDIYPVCLVCEAKMDTQLDPIPTLKEILDADKPKAVEAVKEEIEEEEPVYIEKIEVATPKPKKRFRLKD
jgi:hypothetical protein